MKVVLFCGEHGMRRRNSVEDGTPTLMRMVVLRKGFRASCRPQVAFESASRFRPVLYAAPRSIESLYRGARHD